MGGLLRALLLVGFVVKFWWLILLALAAAAAGFLLWRVATRLDAELERQGWEQCALAARADEQRPWVLAAMSEASTANTHHSKSIEPVPNSCQTGSTAPEHEALTPSQEY